MNIDPANSSNSPQPNPTKTAIFDSDKTWQSLTPAQREIEYSPSSCIGGDYRPFVQKYKTTSQEAYRQAQQLGGIWQRIQLDEVGIEFCRATTNLNSPNGVAPAAPLLVFIHGGYWQELSAKDSLFAAAQCIEHGINFAALDYGLAPQFTLSQIVQQCQTALQHLVTNAQALQVDPTNIVVAGSSAGAHLAALAGLSNTQVHGLVLISGIYELEPLIGTGINEALGLIPQEAKRLSPLLSHAQTQPQAPLHVPNTIICWGQNETSEFKRQSKRYAQLLKNRVLHPKKVSTFEVANTNHFDIVLDLMDSGKQLGQATHVLFASPQ